MKKRVSHLPKILCCVFLALVMIGVTVGVVFTLNRRPDQRARLGVWWWHDNLGTEYLDFAQANNVTEIYYCSDKFNDDTDTFIAAAAKRKMQVYWLAGEYEWIAKPQSVIKQIERYRTYQSTYSHTFAGIHFDIEPHQHPNFKTQRNAILTQFVNLVYDLRAAYPEIWLEYDIPFWLHGDQDTITAHDATKYAYQHIMDQANRVTIMSYRDTAAKIYDVAKEELAYAQTINRPINLGVETKSDEGNQVSFQEEGKAAMYAVIAELRTMVPANVGVVIHQIKHWYDLGD